MVRRAASCFVFGLPPVPQDPSHQGSADVFDVNNDVALKLQRPETWQTDLAGVVGQLQH